jgi:hypothetical protein
MTRFLLMTRRVSRFDAFWQYSDFAEVTGVFRALKTNHLSI